MGKALFLESVAGVAGDMFTAAFLDAGLVTYEELSLLPAQLGLDGVNIEVSSVIRATVKATHLSVKWRDESWKIKFAASPEHANSHDGSHSHGHEHGHDHGDHDHQSGHDHTHENTNILLGDDHERHWHTHHADIEGLIDGSSLDQPVKELSRRIFRVLAEAEADAHGIDIGSVAFHEVGTVDSIMDVVMAAFCFTKAGVDQVFSTPIKPGRGFVKMQHGTHPIPPPASIRLLTGMPVAATPAAVVRENAELSTPTGIAIIKCLDPTFIDELPSGTLLAQGMGAGTLDLGGYPNVFRVALIETKARNATLSYETDTVIEIACNIDDDTSEHIAWMTGKLLGMGALDVWQTPATGKKGRVLVCLSVLVKETDLNAIADWILRNGTTFGIRYREWDRLKLTRAFESREAEGRSVSYKIGYTTDGEKLKEKPEYDDLYGEHPINK